MGRDTGRARGLRAHAESEFYAGRFDAALVAIDEAIEADPFDASLKALKSEIQHTARDPNPVVRNRATEGFRSMDEQPSWTSKLNTKLMFGLAFLLLGLLLVIFADRFFWIAWIAGIGFSAKGLMEIADR